MKASVNTSNTAAGARTAERTLLLIHDCTGNNISEVVIGNAAHADGLVAAVPAAFPVLDHQVAHGIEYSRIRGHFVRVGCPPRYGSFDVCRE